MLELLTTNEQFQWNQVLKSLPHDIYHRAEYLRLYEENGDGQAWGLFFHSAAGTGFYPFLRRPITSLAGTGFFDLSTPYGYGGPVFSNSSSELRTSFQKEFLEFAQEQGFVAEFIRFDPLLQNEKGLESFMDVQPTRRTVYLDLTQTEDKIFQDIISKNRNMIRKAQKSGVEIRESQDCSDLETFEEIYYETMAKNQAGAYYYFSRAFFERKKALLGKKLRLFLAYYQGQIIAGALFMLGERYLHYDLAGSRRQFLGLAPNNLLLYHVALWGQERGFEALHLGGGHKGEDDSLFKFKKAFTHHNFLDFVVGRRILNEAKYLELFQEWLEHNQIQADLLSRDFFPVYRSEL